MSLEEVQGLALGDLVRFDGLIYTCRGLFQRRVIDEDIYPPIDVEKMNVMMHVGPVIRKRNGEWEIVSMQPTTSNRYEKWGPKIIEKLRIRAIIGKGTMGRGTAEAMKRLGCVHLTPVGVAGALLPQKAKVEDVHWYELGPIEATWILEVKDLGPFLVDIDAHGNRYFTGIKGMVEKRLKEAYRKLGIPEDFEYATLSFD